MTHPFRIRLALLLLIAASLGLRAQTNGTNSSYSQFGLGLLSDNSQGFNRGMAGVAQGIRSGKRVNMLNPASYSAIDSLSFIFDVGMSMKFGHFTQGSNSLNAKNTTLSYVNAGLRLRRGLGLSFGFVPYTSIGYNFTQNDKTDRNVNTGQEVTIQNTYYGNGGTHQMYVGLGWNPFHNFSIGANIGYLWGDYNNSVAHVYYEGSSKSSNFNNTYKERSCDIRTYKADIGIQYPIRISASDWLTAGATVGIGHRIKNELTQIRYTSAGDTIKSTASNPFEIPYTYSAGLTWRHKGNLLVAADYTRENWSKCVSAEYTDESTDGFGIDIRQGRYLNRDKFSLGAEYIHNPEGRNYTDHIEYKLGFNYASPYFKVGNEKGPREYGITMGLGLPISPKTVSGSRSMINVSAQWLRRAPSATNLIKENYFILNLGITFNERWFMKWKIN